MHDNDIDAIYCLEIITIKMTTQEENQDNDEINFTPSMSMLWQKDNVIELLNIK